MTITIEQLKQLIPSNHEVEIWHSLAVEFLEKYNINTVNRIAGFFAQGGHESNDFNTLFENLNYSWQSLRKTFPRYFPTDSMAKEYERNPQKIANRVYNDAYRVSKMGNTGPEDGWRYRGRGIFQLTGKNNYTAFGNYIGMSPEEAAAYCGTKRGAFESACWFWSMRNLSNYADKDDIKGMSSAVNGGNIGLEDRILRYNKNKKILTSIGNVNTNVDVKRTIVYGNKGEDVKKVQIALGFVGNSADGVYGNKTGLAIKSWQKSKGYIVDGKLTPEQYNILVV